MSEDNMKFIDNINVMCKILEDIGLKFLFKLNTDSIFEYYLHFSGTFFIGDVENFKSKLNMAITSIWKLTESTNIKVNVEEPTEKNYFENIYNINIEYRFPIKSELLLDKPYVASPDYFDTSQLLEAWENFKQLVREKMRSRNTILLIDTIDESRFPIYSDQTTYLLSDEEQIRQLVWIFTNDIQLKNSISDIIHSRISKKFPEIYLDLVNDRICRDKKQKQLESIQQYYINDSFEDKILNCFNIFEKISESKRYTSINIHKAIYKSAFMKDLKYEK